VALPAEVGAAPVYPGSTGIMTRQARPVQIPCMNWTVAFTGTVVALN
jgi:hypothetical protein